jgi:hypothetical protein
MIATETDIDRRFQKLYFENKNIELKNKNILKNAYQPDWQNVQ